MKTHWENQLIELTDLIEAITSFHNEHSEAEQEHMKEAFFEKFPAFRDFLEDVSDRLDEGYIIEVILDWLVIVNLALTNKNIFLQGIDMDDLYAAVMANQKQYYYYNRKPFEFNDEGFPVWPDDHRLVHIMHATNHYIEFRDEHHPMPEAEKILAPTTMMLFADVMLANYNENES